MCYNYHLKVITQDYKEETTNEETTSTLIYCGAYSIIFTGTVYYKHSGLSGTEKIKDGGE